MSPVHRLPPPRPITVWDLLWRAVKILLVLGLILLAVPIMLGVGPPLSPRVLSVAVLLLLGLEVLDD